MKKTLTTFSFILLAAVLTTGCNAVMTKKPDKTVIDGFLSPESVVANASGTRFFVSNVGEKLAPSTKDKDGFISELTPTGSLKTRRFLPKDGVLHAPKGMAVIGNTLYVADIDRIKGFDLDSRAQVFELDLSTEKTVFLNDLAVFDSTTLFVSATDTGKIYGISVGGRPAYTLVAQGIRGPNGLFYDSEFRVLYVVGFGSKGKPDGELGAVFFTENAPPEYGHLTGKLGYLDGVTLLDDGRVIFSDWVSFKTPGVLRSYNLDTAELSELELGSDARGPADFYYDRKTKKLWLPRMMEGSVAVEVLR